MRDWLIPARKAQETENRTPARFDDQEGSSQAKSAASTALWSGYDARVPLLEQPLSLVAGADKREPLG